MARGASRRSVSALITLVLAVLLFAMGTQAQNGHPVAPQFPDIHLPAPARGGDALSALAPYLQEIAASHGKSVDELRNLLLSDNTLWTDTRGRLYYGCELGTPPVNARIHSRACRECR